MLSASSGRRSSTAKSTSHGFQANRELSDDQLTELREAYDLFDSEKSGRIDLHELKVRDMYE